MDLNPAVQPTFVEDATRTHFEDDEFDLVLADPPYGKENAAIYGFPLPKVKETILECRRITRPGGFYGLMHWIAPVNWGKDEGTAVIAITEGANMRIRVWCLFRKRDVDTG